MRAQIVRAQTSLGISQNMLNITFFFQVFSKKPLKSLEIILKGIK